MNMTDARDGGRKAEAVVGAEDVVVHRLRDGDERHAFLVQAPREGERAVAAEGDERVELEELDDAQRRAA